ncbi:WD repeat protein-like protein [Xylogone sp. PMI_703]|nr:WD repeat protein-like protein [Xylogone sp. PMI_703]
MLTESFITSIRAQPKAPNTAIAKDVGIHVQTLHPAHAVKSTLKKSSTGVNSLAASQTHIFAAQADKAVIHVYTREDGKQETLVSFPEKIRSLALIGDGIVVVGTIEGRIMLWEVATGRHVSTPAAHLQEVSCITGDLSNIITGSEDSNIHVWSTPKLLSLSNKEAHQPVRTLQNHRAPITSLVTGHSSSTTNICVSVSKDNSCIVWNYQSGDLLRTFLLPSTPLCVTLDPCDRAAYVGFQDGSIQMIDFVSSTSGLNPLFDPSLQSAPTQTTLPPWTATSEVGDTHCLGLSYDGTALLSGHASGKVLQWDVGRRAFSSELVDLNAPVTNLIMLSPFPEKRATKVVSVVKPDLRDGNYTMRAQLVGNIGISPNSATAGFGFPQGRLEDMIERFYAPTAATSSNEDDKKQAEIDELWKVIREQQALQKKTLQKYNELKANRT